MVTDVDSDTMHIFFPDKEWARRHMEKMKKNQERRRIPLKCECTKEGILKCTFIVK